MSGARLAAVLALVILAAHALGAVSLAPLRRIDDAWHDLRLRLLAPSHPDPRLAVVAIDEASLAAVGQWPWDRARLAQLLDRLFEGHAPRAVGLDLVLAEPQSDAALALLRRLQADPALADAAVQQRLSEVAEPLDGDARLAQALQGRPVVLGQQLLPAAASGTASADGAGWLDGRAGVVPALANAARATGFLEARVDADGVRRRGPLLARVDGQPQRSFALALAQVARRDAGWRLSPPGAADAWVALLARGGGEDTRLALGPGAEVLLPLRPPAAQAPVHAAADVLSGRVPREALDGRVVLIGITAAGLGDRHPTPLQEAMPGVQGQAALVAALLDGRIPSEPPGCGAAALAAGGLLAAVAIGRRRPPMAVARWAAALLVPWLGLSLAAWAWSDRALPVAVPLVMLGGLALAQIARSLLRERRRRHELESLFGRYVPPELVQRLRESPHELSLQGRSAELTIMFADLHGFTRIAEGLPPPELAALMNEFLSEMTDIVRRHGGTLDKYIGDALMAFWGAPLDDPQHAARAVAAAREMHAALPALNARFTARGWPALQLGIGINSGPVVVGDLGSRHRRAYTVIGDAVNVAARLQGLTARLGEPTLLGEDTARRLPPEARRAVGIERLRGRRAPVAVHAPA